MPHYTQDLLILFIASLTANILSAFAGGGAGLIQLPILIFSGLPFNIALATHKIASIALGLGASIRYYKEKPLIFPFALFILATGLPGVMSGAVTILRIPEQYSTLALGILTLSLGFYSITKKSLGTQTEYKHRTLSGYIIGGIVLYIIGVLNGSLTSGTGLFVTLWLVRWFGLDYQSAISYTLILVGLFWNATGAITLGMLTTIRWDWLPILLLGSLLGGYIGTHLAIKKGNFWIKRIFEITTIIVGLKLIWRVIA